MYKFNSYWTDQMRIDFLQRTILLHCYLYYECDNPIWSDRKYDEISRQLTEEQNKHSKQWIKQNTQYGYVFYDFDGSTGFDLWDRLKQKDREQTQKIARMVLRQW